ncbi:uncharacterized protein LOC111013528 isoform X3 [Momordica charantia]|nr:uncharacterized protein LOC111013528 isoform X3 [Momordica charantia]
MVPVINCKVKFKKKKLAKRLKKKKVKKKKNKGIGSMAKIEAHKGQSCSPIQLPEAQCSEKNDDMTPGRSGEPVREDGPNHSEATTSAMSNFLGHNCYVAQPIVEPVWRGSLRFWNKSFGRLCVLVAHMSSLACSKVYEEAKLLPQLLSVELLRRCDIWPKGFEKVGPTDQSIALYFFPEGESSEKAFDLLVNSMMCKDLAMKAVLKNAELLVFTSSMLPMQYWRFQARYYLWGVFRGRQALQQINNVASTEKTFSESLHCMQSPVSSLRNPSILHSVPLHSTGPPLS